jgi:lambda repressor-like predicted transcriptional regulator
MKLEYSGKSIQKELKKKIEKKEPAVPMSLPSKCRRSWPSRYSRITK